MGIHPFPIHIIYTRTYSHTKPPLRLAGGLISGDGMVGKIMMVSSKLCGIYRATSKKISKSATPFEIPLHGCVYITDVVTQNELSVRRPALLIRYSNTYTTDIIPGDR